MPPWLVNFPPYPFHTPLDDLFSISLAGLGVPDPCLDIQLRLPDGSIQVVQMASNTDFRTILKKFNSNLVIDETSGAVLASFVKLQPNSLYRVVQYNEPLLQLSGKFVFEFW